MHFPPDTHRPRLESRARGPRRPTCARARIVVGLLLVSSVATAAPEQCLGTGRTQNILDVTLLGVANPVGLEHQVRFSVCVPLIRRPGLLFDYTQVEVGLYQYLSPVCVIHGAFV